MAKASKEVLLLSVDTSTSTEDDGVVCTGENRAASRWRKKSKGGAINIASSLPDVSIVSVENAKPKKSKSTNSKTQEDGSPAIFVVDSPKELTDIVDVIGTSGSRPLSGESASNSGSAAGVGPSGESLSISTVEDIGGPSSAGQTQVDTDYEAALKLDRVLNSIPSVPPPKSNLDKDHILARSLQEREYSRALHKKKSIPSSPPSSASFSSLSPLVPSDKHLPSPGSSSVTDGLKDSDTVHSKTSSTSRRPKLLEGSFPKCWTDCPRCPPGAVRKYHLIDVVRDSAEWGVIARPIADAGFTVVKVQRIQNEMFWQRLCLEKQLMLRERSDVNERFLYHTSRAGTSVICEEGLDQRLSANTGSFGGGIYFSDNPLKCNTYWRGIPSACNSKTMFCCRVLLGHTKIYPNGVKDLLVREPLKENPLPGEPKTYDSVQGNITGQNEFVVYNMYRVMPEYVIEYTDSTYEALHKRVDNLSRLVNHAIRKRAAPRTPRKRSTKRKKY